MAHLEVEQHISTGILGRGTIFEITPQSVKPEVPVTKPNEREVPVIPSPIPERLPVG